MFTKKTMEKNQQEHQHVSKRQDLEWKVALSTLKKLPTEVNTAAFFYVELLKDFNKISRWETDKGCVSGF